MVQKSRCALKRLRLSSLERLRFKERLVAGWYSVAQVRNEPEQKTDTVWWDFWELKGLKDKSIYYLKFAQCHSWFSEWVWTASDSVLLGDDEWQWYHQQYDWQKLCISSVVGQNDEWRTIVGASLSGSFISWFDDPSEIHLEFFIIYRLFKIHRYEIAWYR